MEKIPRKKKNASKLVLPVVKTKIRAGEGIAEWWDEKKSWFKNSLTPKP